MVAVTGLQVEPLTGVAVGPLGVLVAVGGTGVFVRVGVGPAVGGTGVLVAVGVTGVFVRVGVGPGVFVGPPLPVNWNQFTLNK